MANNNLETVEVTPNGTAQASVIWLHGLGADGHDFEPIVPHLHLPDTIKVRFVFPHAPKQPVTVNGGYVMRAWYDIYEQALDRKVDLEGIQTSSKYLERLIAREIDFGISPTNIILAGFSQGGVIALETGLRFQPKLAGIVALSTYLAAPDQIPSGNLPIFVGHGTFDPVVPFNLGQQIRDTLQKSGHSVQWHSYPMEHSVCMEEIGAIGKWIIERLGATLPLQG